MKKKLALLLACTMALSLTACGGSGTAGTTKAAETTAADKAGAADICNLKKKRRPAPVCIRRRQCRI